MLPRLAVARSGGGSNACSRLHNLCVKHLTVLLHGADLHKRVVRAKAPVRHHKRHLAELGVVAASAGGNSGSTGLPCRMPDECAMLDLYNDPLRSHTVKKRSVFHNHVSVLYP